jgi:predicted CoA-binding protein
MVKVLITLNPSDMKKTLVIGASMNPERYSNMAVKRLKKYGHEVIAIGLREGEIDGIPIHTDHPGIKDLDTVTLYLNEKNQAAITDYLLSLKPVRVIFNPGTENEKLKQQLNERGIVTDEACTLTLLATGQY